MFAPSTFLSDSRNSLLHWLVGFGRALRAGGVAVNPASLSDLCRATDCIDIGEREDLRAAARATLVCKYEELETFDRIFDEFWKRNEQELRAPTPGRDEQEHDEQGPRRDIREDAYFETLLEADREGDDSADRSMDVNDDVISYSDSDGISGRDLGELDADELKDARKLVARLAKLLRNRPGRRFRTARRGRLVDFRRSFRGNLSHGFAAIELKYRRPRRKKVRLVLLCDVSGSMARYSAFLLEFIYALRHELPATEAAIFSTHLTPISESLQVRDIAASLREVSSKAAGFGDGTNIGTSLFEFNKRYAQTMMRSKAIVVVLSDGWDRGDAALMRREIARLGSRAHKLIWLNPLLGADGYQPLCEGMAAALPHLDHFLPAHNLASLAAATEVLRGAQA